jgi:hypothetical protein
MVRPIFRSEILNNLPYPISLEKKDSNAGCTIQGPVFGRGAALDSL